MKVRHTIFYLSSIIIIGAYCVGNVQIYYLRSDMIFRAYCVGKAHSMLFFGRIMVI